MPLYQVILFFHFLSAYVYLRLNLITTAGFEPTSQGLKVLYSTN